MAIFQYYTLKPADRVSTPTEDYFILPNASSAEWVDIPDPAKYTFNLAELDSENTGRNSNGNMLRDVITSKRQLNLEWNALDGDDIKEIYDAIRIRDEAQGYTGEDQQYRYFFGLKYPDAATNNDEEIRVFYCGDKSTPAYHYNSNGDVEWAGMTVNFIER